MGNVNDKLAYIAGTKQAIKTAIEAKGIEVPMETTFREYAAKIGDIPVPPGEEPTEYLVRFIDYEGTILKEQTVIEGQDATAPTPPTHEYLTFNSWNTPQTNITRNKDIGAIYDTTDGKSYLFLSLTMTTGISPTLFIKKYSADLMTVNWGDGNESTSDINGSLTFNHDYAAEGDYIITISCPGNYTLGQGGSSTYFLYSSTGYYSQSLTRLLIGANVTTLPHYCFNSSSILKTVSIPATVQSFNYSPFANCYSLKACIIPDGVTSIQNSSFYFNYSLEIVSIPETVTEILIQAFSNCYQLPSICLPDSLLTIKEQVFEINYSLKSITLPRNLQSLVATCFQYCYALESVIFKNPSTTIGMATFQYCYSLVSVKLPESLELISPSLFYYCYSLRSIELPSTITTIQYNAFQYCYSLESVVIPEGTTYIGSAAFQECYALVSAVLPSTITVLPTYLFKNCYRLNSVILGNDLRTINLYTFAYCYSLSSIEIPSSLTSLASSSFYSCKSLLSIVIPEGVTLINSSTFKYCSILADIQILSPTLVPLGATTAFSVMLSCFKIYVPDDLVETYKADVNWVTFVNNIYPLSSRPV